MTAFYSRRIAPFGHLRVKDHLHLSAAFRSLSRPSSAGIAKASTVRPLYLDLRLFFHLDFLALFEFPSVRKIISSFVKSFLRSSSV